MARYEHTDALFVGGLDWDRRLFAVGAPAMIVPSFEPGAPASGRNMVLWAWAEAQPHQVRVIDDNRRLPNSLGPWLARS